MDVSRVLCVVLVTGFGRALHTVKVFKIWLVPNASRCGMFDCSDISPHKWRHRSYFQGGGSVVHILLSPMVEISAQIWLRFKLRTLWRCSIVPQDMSLIYLQFSSTFSNLVLCYVYMYVDVCKSIHEIIFYYPTVIKISQTGKGKIL